MLLFPVVTSMPKELKSGITFVVASNGLFEIRRLSNGGFISHKIEGIKELQPVKEEIRFLEKKVPFKFYNIIVEFFRTVSKKFNENLEAYIEIGYNQKTQEYFLYVPKQIVSGAHVQYQIKDFYDEFKDCYIVANFHSHNNFGAFFSSTDNNDDCRDQYSGVIGNLNNLIPDVKIRFAAGKKHFDLKLEDLFDNSESDYIFNIEESLNKISKPHKVTTDKDDIYTYYCNNDYMSGSYLEDRYKSIYKRENSLYSFLLKGNKGNKSVRK